MYPTLNEYIYAFSSSSSLRPKDEVFTDAVGIGGTGLALSFPPFVVAVVDLEFKDDCDPVRRREMAARGE